jgi:hypothetical protein
MRLLAVIEMQGRDLFRRRVALLLLVAVPPAFTAAQHHSSAYDDPPLRGGIGMAFSVTGMALFSMLASRQVDPRLLLAGYRAWQLVVGRLFLLLGVAFAIAGVFYAFLLAVARPYRPELAILGVAIVAVVSVPLGLLLAVLLQRELEGTLVIIGLVGVEESLPLTTFGAQFLPHYGAAQYLVASWDGFAPISGRWILYSLTWALGLLALALALWWRRTAVRRPRRSTAEQLPPQPATGSPA